MHRENKWRQPRQAALFETPQDQPLWRDFPAQVKFFELGSARQVSKWLIEHRVDVPTRKKGATG